MADAPLPFWRLDRFGDMYDAWLAIDSPDADKQGVVLRWIAAHADNPYQGVRKVLEIPGMWFGQIPGTRDADGAMVCCSFMVFDEDRTVRCDMLASLKPPF